MRLVGFNITDFMGMDSLGATSLSDLAVIRQLGFNFVRIPLNYRLWQRINGSSGAEQSFLGRIDRAVNAALDNGLHVCLALHRAPGYTVSREGGEPGNLWRDPVLQERFVGQWVMLAERYADAPGAQLSFNLINEPGPVSESMSREDHERVVRTAMAAIRKVTPGRRIIVDGLRWGRDPLPELADTDAWQSCRGYEPFVLTHYDTWRAHRLQPNNPHWPMTIAGKGVLDAPWLRGRYRAWETAMARGIKVHCGEVGCSHTVPHDVMLAWLRDLLGVFDTIGIGFALWNFRGPFGLVNSGRQEGVYDEAPYGKVDRAILDRLQQSLHVAA